MAKFTIDQIRDRLLTEGEQTRIRAIEIDRADINEEEMILPMSVSSEYPVETWYGFEILDHKKSSIVMDRFKDGGSIRDTHFGDQVGNIQNPKVDSGTKKLRIDARCSKNNPRAVLLYQDYRDGYRKNVSIRFIVHDIILDHEVEGVPYYRITKWEPIHVAFEPDPADPSVGVGRSKNNEPQIIPIDLSKNPEETIEKFNRENENGIQIKLITNQRSSTMPPELSQEEKDRLLKEEKERIDRAVEEAGKKEAARIANITAVSRDFKPLLRNVDLDKEATKYIEDRTKSSEDFFTFVRSKMKEPDAMKAPNTRLGLSDKETKSYSMRNIILYQLGKLDAKEVGLELEAHRALVEAGINPTNKNGCLLPDEILNRRRELRVGNMNSRERDLAVGSLDTGGYLVRDEYTSYSFIELLQNSMAFFKAGVDVITGLVGNIPMNRELDNYTYYHVGEGSGPTKSGITFSQETMSPKKAGALAKYSYEFLRQGQPGNNSVEAYIERKLAIACGLGADRDIGYGSGSQYQPKGLKLWTGTGAVAGAGFTRDKALTMSGQLYTGNAQDLGTMKFLSRGDVRATLQGKKIDVGSGLYLVNDQNQMIGKDYSLVSNQIDDGDLMLGIWNQILVGFWNQFEIAANPFGDEEFAAGDVKVRALQALDVFVLNPAAFSIATGVN